MLMPIGHTCCSFYLYILTLCVHILIVHWMMEIMIMMITDYLKRLTHIKNPIVLIFRFSSFWNISTKTNALCTLCDKWLQLCPSLCDPMDCCPLGSSVHGILQARILECVHWSHALLQGNFPTQGLNLSILCLLHWQAGSLLLVPPGKQSSASGSCLPLFLLLFTIVFLSGSTTPSFSLRLSL